MNISTIWRCVYVFINVDLYRVQAEELSESQIILTQKYSEAAAALQTMIQERQTINNNLHTVSR